MWLKTLVSIKRIFNNDFTTYIPNVKLISIYLFTYSKLLKLMLVQFDNATTNKYDKRKFVDNASISFYV